MLTLIQCQFHPCVTAATHKRLQSFCQNADGRFHLNTCTLLTLQSGSELTVLSRHSVGTYLGKRAHTQLIRKCSATVSLQSHCGLILFPPPKKSGIGVRKLISLFFFFFNCKVQAGNECSNLHSKISQARKTLPPPPLCRWGVCYTIFQLHSTFLKGLFFV